MKNDILSRVNNKQDAVGREKDIENPKKERISKIFSYNK